MPEFIEHTALNLAYEDAEADSGNHDPLDAYLRENFLPKELRLLCRAAEVLAERAWAMRNDSEAVV